jgi:hypothetical protein
MASKKSSQLADALNRKIIVRFSTPFEPGWVEGYVLDIGPRFFLLAIIDDYQKFNGFQCSRISDVRQLRVPAPYADFIVAALRKRGQIIRRKPNINLAGLPELLKTASRLFPLITIHRQEAKPDICEIGRAIDVDKNRLLFHEIDPGAIWYKRLTSFPLNEITRVEFGGGYEEALHLVGGEPKEIKSHSR